MAEYFLEQGLYTYTASPSWAGATVPNAQEGDGRNGSGFVAGTITYGGSGDITNIAITNGGSGYSPNTKVFITGDGSGANISVSTVDASGGITAFTYTSGGTGYSTATVSLVPGAAIAAEMLVSFSAVPTGTSFTMFGSATISVTGVSGAASAAAAATALASNINAATQTVSASISPGTHQVRDFFYAVASGDTVKIMTRAGSQQHNYADNPTYAVLATNLTNCTITQAGDSSMQKGRSGCWGYWINQSGGGTLWPSAKSEKTYGAMFSDANKAALAGPATAAADRIWIRGNNSTIYIEGTGGFNMVPTASGEYFVDDGTIWKSDTDGYVKFDWYASASSTLRLGFSAYATIVWGALKMQGLRIELLYSVGSTALTLGSYTNDGVGTTFKNLYVHDRTPNALRLTFGAAGAYSWRCRVDNLYFRAETSAWGIPFNASGSEDDELYIDNATIYFPNFTLTAGSLCHITTATGDNKIVQLKNIQTQFGSTPAGLPPLFTVSSTTASSQIAAIASNCNGVSLPTTVLGFTGSRAVLGSVANYVVLQNIGEDHGFRLEDDFVMYDWVPDAGYPTLNSYFPNGTAWCYRWIWYTTTNIFALGRPINVITLTKTFLETASVATIDLELFVDDAYDHLITDEDLAIVVSYIANADDKQMGGSSSHLLGFGVPIESSSKVWTGNSYAGTHVARKLSYTTDVAVKPNTEITVTLKAMKPATAIQDVFINPEVTITV